MSQDTHCNILRIPKLGTPCFTSMIVDKHNRVLLFQLRAFMT